MTPVISEQIRQAIEEHQGQPVRVVDDVTKQAYYVVSAQQFEAIRALFAEGEFQPRDAYPLIAKTAAEAGWSDPAMDAYNDYDEQRPQS